MLLIMRFLTLVMFLCASSLFASIGKVSLLKGDASLERAGQKMGLKNGMGIEEKDTIRTLKEAQIQLIFEDKTVITLGGESEFKVEEYLSETAKPKAKFKFNQGVFKTITGQIGKTAPENFTLETKTATIGIRGTVIGGVVPPPSSNAPDTIFCLGGKITATSRQSGVTVALPSGTMTVVPTNAPPAPPRQTTPQDLQQFNQTLGTPPPPPPSSPTDSSSSSQSGSSSSTQSEAAPTQSNSSGSQSSSNNTPSVPQSIGMNEAPPAPPPPPSMPEIQTFTPTAATAAQQMNLQTLTQEVVVVDVAVGLGVPVEEVKEQIASGNPIILPPTDPVTPPPTDPIIPPTDPVTPPPTDPIIPPTDPVTPPPTDPIIPPTDPIIPPTDPVTPPPSGGGGGEVVQTCPAGTTGTYPNCISTTNLVGYATSRYSVQNGYTQTCYSESVDINISSNNTLAGSLIIVNKSGGDNHNLALGDGNVTVNYADKTFSSTDFNGTGTYFGTVANSPSPYVSWGEWTSLEMDGNLTAIATPYNYWVAGKNSAEAQAVLENRLLLETTTSYSYEGKAIGATFDGEAYKTINPADPTNKVLLTFNLGSQNNSIDTAKSYMRFTPVGGSLWSLYFTDGAVESNGFYAYAENNSVYGHIEGLFYGTEAQSLGGAFAFEHNQKQESAWGAVIANNVATPTYNFQLEGYTASQNSSGGLMFSQLSNDDILGWIGENLDLGSSDKNITDSQNFSLTNFDIEGTKLETNSSISPYVSWGEWTSVEIDTNTTNPYNYWAAGEERAAAATVIGNAIISEQPAVYNYNGKALGTTFDGVSTYMAITPTDPTNKLSLTFNIGSQSMALDYARSFMTFTPEGGTLWDIRFSNFEYEAFFYIGADNIYYGSAYGSFYGNNAQAIGGTFWFHDNNSTTAYGAFIGDQTPLNFSGLATSAFLNDGNITYSISDEIAFDVNLTYAVGAITLMNENNASRGSIGFEGNITAENYMGNGIFTMAESNTQNDYVSWGYWNATEIENNATLMAGTNYWVVGSQTSEDVIASHISANTVYNYSGNVLGSVSNGTTTESILMDGNNIFNADIQFGSANPVTVTQMSFATSTLGSVNETSALTSLATTSAISGNTFSGNATNTNTALDLKGKFFGPNAEAIGGAWKGTFNSGALSGTGVFKGVREITGGAVQ